MKIYDELKKEIELAKATKSNLLIVSVAGMGTGHLLKQYVAENKGIIYVNGPNQELGKEGTVLYLATDIDTEAVDWAGKYMRSVMSGQKFVVSIISPGILNSEKYKKSYLCGQIHKVFWLRPLLLEEVKEMIGQTGVKMGVGEIEKLFSWSGGIIQLIKCLLANHNLLSEDVEKAMEKQELIDVISRIMYEIGNCSMWQLDKLGLMTDGRLTSELLNLYQKRNGGLTADIKLDDDLSVWENGVKTVELSTKIEKDILAEMVRGGGLISKEKVSDLKWGEGKYDEYSDQAINKQMRRLSAKLEKYEIETIPKIGFKIVER